MSLNAATAHLKLKISLSENDPNDLGNALMDLRIVGCKNVEAQFNRAGMHIESNYWTQRNIRSVGFNSLNNVIRVSVKHLLGHRLDHLELNENVCLALSRIPRVFLTFSHALLTEATALVQPQLAMP